MDAEPLLHMQHISKAFPGVQALKAVSLSVYPGEIVALVGENGAGKSTLMKILNGIYPPDSGAILWQGKPVTISSPHVAQTLGISMIHQEIMLVPHLSVAENIYLGRQPQGHIKGMVNWRQMYSAAAEQLRQLDLDIDPRTPVRKLSIAQQQMVEVAKALSLDARLVVMDEPTSSLTMHEVQALFARIRELSAAGVAVIYISHRQDEIFAIADRMIILRDGEFITSELIRNMTPNRVIAQMVGHTVDDLFPRPRVIVGDPLLQVFELSTDTKLHDISFTLHRGEILGIAGLVGAGRTELGEALFGARRIAGGHILLEGELVEINSPAQAIAHGIGFVPEDRKAQGLFMQMTVSDNVVMVWIQRLAPMRFLRAAPLTQIADRFANRLKIIGEAHQAISSLSGGNQQKVIMARWLTLEPKVLILDEPTRGIDVGAKAEIHLIMRQLAQAGVGILMISSELPEILGVSDRVLVMHDGTITAEFDPRHTTQDQVMRSATGEIQMRESAARQ